MLVLPRAGPKFRGEFSPPRHNTLLLPARDSMRISEPTSSMVVPGDDTCVGPLNTNPVADNAKAPPYA